MTDWIANEADALHHLQQVTTSAARDIEAIINELDSGLGDAWWQGHDAQEFHKHWCHDDRRALLDAVHALRTLSRQAGATAGAEDSRFSAQSRSKAKK